MKIKLSQEKINNNVLKESCMPKIESLRNYIKEYIDEGHDLSDIKKNFGISAQVKDDLVILKYSQEDSPKTEPIVRQSRGIILEKDTNEIVHYPFYRFFNYGECLKDDQNFNWQNATVSEKLDGSIMGIFNHQNNWYLCTSSQIGGDNLVSRAPFTYRELVDMATGGFDTLCEKLNPRYDYTFELVSPFNRIITPYDSTRLYLIGCRDKDNDFREIPFYEAYKTENIIPASIRDKIYIPIIFNIIDESGNFRTIEDISTRANALNETDEGFVVIDFSSYDPKTGSFPRMKVKNQNYLAIKYLHASDKKNSVSYEDLFRVVMQAEESEFLTAMPEFRDLILSIKNKWEAFRKSINEALEKDNVKELLAIPPEERLNHMKQFVDMLKDHPYNRFLFSMYKNGGSSFQDMINGIQKRYGEEQANKMLWQIVKHHA